METGFGKDSVCNDTGVGRGVIQNAGCVFARCRRTGSAALWKDQL